MAPLLAGWAETTHSRMDDRNGQSKPEARPARQEAGPRRGQLLTGLAILAAAALGSYFFFSPSMFSPDAEPVNYRDPAVIAEGGMLYARHCAVCHGAAAAGEDPRHRKGGLKPAGGYWAPALDGSAHAWHHPPDGLFRMVKDGSPAKDSPMRGWREQMSDAEIHAVLAYVQSLWPEDLRLRYERAFSGK